MSDDYRDGCSRKVGLVLLLMPFALVRYLIDLFRA